MMQKLADKIRKKLQETRMTIERESQQITVDHVAVVAEF